MLEFCCTNKKKAFNFASLSKKVKALKKKLRDFWPYGLCDVWRQSCINSS